MSSKLADIGDHGVDESKDHSANAKYKRRVVRDYLRVRTVLLRVPRVCVAVWRCAIVVKGSIRDSLLLYIVHRQGTGMQETLSDAVHTMVSGPYLIPNPFPYLADAVRHEEILCVAPGGHVVS